MAKWTHVVFHHPALPLVLATSATILVGWPTWAMIKARQIRTRILPGVATVLEKEQIPFRGSFHCWVEFGGRRCRIRVKQRVGNGVRLGQTLNVRYDPEKPGEIVHGKFRSSRKVALVHRTSIAFGVLVGIIAWRLWWITPPSGFSISKAFHNIASAIRPLIGF